jgi:plastocyanin domain-containing protein
MVFPLMLAAAAIVAGCAGKPASTEGDATRVAITVTEKGFEPAVVNVPFGKPVTLVVTRKTDQTCAKDLVMADHGIKEDLPLEQAVEITFTPKERGDVRYACGMNMITGTVRVE